MPTLPSEARIEDALRALKSASGKFQEFAEAFMKAKYGGEFYSLVPQGRNQLGQTTKGYPDIHAPAPSGRRHVVEATVALDWRQHLENEDLPGLQKLKKSGVASFALFALQDADPLISQKNANAAKAGKSEGYFRKEIAQRGVPADKIEFYFLNTLVQELRDARYLGVLAELGLQIDCYPFVPLAEVVQLGIEAPKAEEFRQERVVCAQRLRKIAPRLRPGSVMVLRGRGGVGKTSLALALAHSWSFSPVRQALYADVAHHLAAGGVAALVQRIREFGAPNVLFVLDNCHLLGAADLLQLTAAGISPAGLPTILLCGKDVPADFLAALRGMRAMVEEVNVDLQEGDLLAAYRLYAWRVTRNDTFELPTPGLLSTWLAATPDLVSFCLNLQAGRRELAAGYLPEVSEQGADDYVQAHYIAPLSAGDRAALIVIATLAGQEIAASKTSLGGAVPAKLMELGLARPEPTKAGTEVRLRLPHDKLGPRLLKRFSEHEQRQAYAEAIARDLFQTCFIIRRMLARDERAEAAQLLRSVDSELWRFSSAWSLGYAGDIWSLYAAAGVSEDFWQDIPANFKAYLDGKPDFLNGMDKFMTFASNRADVADACWALLLSKAGDGALRRAFRYVHPEAIHHLLSRAEQHSTATRAALAAVVADQAVMAAAAGKLITLRKDEVNHMLLRMKELAAIAASMLRTELLAGERLSAFRSSLLRASDKALLEWTALPELFELVLTPELTKNLLARSSGVALRLFEKLAAQSGRFGPNATALLERARECVTSAWEDSDDMLVTGRRLCLLFSGPGAGKTAATAYVKRLEKKRILTEPALARALGALKPVTLLVLMRNAEQHAGAGALSLLKTELTRSVPVRLPQQHQPYNLPAFASLYYLACRLKLAAHPACTRTESELNGVRAGLAQDIARHAAARTLPTLIADAL